MLPMGLSFKDRELAFANSNFRWSGISRVVKCLFGLALSAILAHADSVTLNLGVTAEVFTMAGTGANGSGLGTYVVTMGACTATGANTTCTLSGSFTSTNPGFTSGTYTLVSVYPGSAQSPFLGVEQSAGSNYFAFSYVPAAATMTLTLRTSSGTVVVPMLASGQFVTGNSFGFLYTPSATCSGTPVSACNVGQVGVTSASSITGPVTGTATFTQSSRNYYFSHLTFGGGYQMTVTYVNYSPQTVTCTTKFHGDSGDDLSVPFKQGTIATRTDTLPPGQMVHDESVADLNSPEAKTGWAEGNCSGPVQASLLFRYFRGGEAQGECGVNAETAPATKFATFCQTQCGVAFSNPSPTQAADVTLTILGSTGAKLGSTSITVPPLGHSSANPGPLMKLGSFSGVLFVTSSIPILSLSINAEAFPVFSSLPPGDLPDAAVIVTP